MRIGVGIFLFTVGAVLKFALRWRPSGLSLPTVGVILMLVGVVWIVAAVLLYRNQRRSMVVTERRQVPGAPGADGEYVEERRSYGEPDPRGRLWGAGPETTPYAEPQPPVAPPPVPTAPAEPEAVPYEPQPAPYERDESDRPLWPGGRGEPR